MQVVFASSFRFEYSMFTDTDTDTPLIQLHHRWDESMERYGKPWFHVRDVFTKHHESLQRPRSFKALAI